MRLFSDTYFTVLAARTLISNKRQWIAGQSAARDDGSLCQPNSEEARRWCANGAIDAVQPNSRINNRAKIALGEASMTLHGDLTFTVNDSECYGHKSILRAFDAALGAAK